MTPNGNVTTNGLLTRELLERVASADPTLKGTKPETYGLEPDQRTRDIVAKAWTELNRTYTTYQQKTHKNLPTTRDQWVLPLLHQLGYTNIQTHTQNPTLDEKPYPIKHQWKTHTPIHIVAHTTSLNKRSPGVAGATKQSPHSLLQEYLNRSEQHLWGILTDGKKLRLLRDNASLTRIAYCEYDLETIFKTQNYSDFAALWLTFHSSRLHAETPEKTLIEHWVHEANKTGARALDKLRDGVEAAITTLGKGFLQTPGNTQLHQQLQNKTLTPQQYQHQLLRTTYRLIFLLVAEHRRLLHPPNTDPTTQNIYHKHYSLQKLHQLATTPNTENNHTDLWETVKLIFTKLAATSPPTPELGLEPLGGELWDPDFVPHLTDTKLTNRALLKTIRHLTITHNPENQQTLPVDYINLGAREIGSIYESLLELEPQINTTHNTFRLTTRAGNTRKTTGSYYTPERLITQLLDENLNPLLTEAANSTNPEQTLLNLKILDPACGSGHFLIAAAHRIANQLAATRAGNYEPGPDDLHTALRDVIGNCLYGVDINPMSVELCKISLWMEANTNGKPLGFLNHHIICGNALIGVSAGRAKHGIPNEAYKKSFGDNPETLKTLRKLNKNQLKNLNQLALNFDTHNTVTTLSSQLANIHTQPEHTAQDVSAKHKNHQQWKNNPDHKRLKLMADIWCAAFVAPKTPNHPNLLTEHITQARNNQTLHPNQLNLVRELTRKHRFTHFALEFPDVYQQHGGFDLVIGNPPWDVIQLAEKEWFATKNPHIADAGTKAERGKRIKQLLNPDTKHHNPALHQQYLDAKQQIAGQVHFIRNSGLYSLSSSGKTNTYRVFSELIRTQLNPNGRAGFIVPSNLAFDDSSKKFFADLVNTQTLTSFYDFENREQTFAGCHKQQRFALVSIGGEKLTQQEAEFAFFLTNTEHLSEKERMFTLTKKDFELFNPNTRTCPSFRTGTDKNIVQKMHQQAGVLWEEKEGDTPDINPWGLRTIRHMNMSDGSHLFRTKEQLEQDGWELKGNFFVKNHETYFPLYEAKMFHQYDHRFATFEGRTPKQRKAGNARTLSPQEKENPQTVALPRYWIPESAMPGRGSVKDSAPPPPEHYSVPHHHHLHQSTNSHRNVPAIRRNRELRQQYPNWKIMIRDITTSTNQRTAIAALLPYARIGSSVNQRTAITSMTSSVAIGGTIRGIKVAAHGDNPGESSPERQTGEPPSQLLSPSLQ